MPINLLLSPIGHAPCDFLEFEHVTTISGRIIFASARLVHETGWLVIAASAWTRLFGAALSAGAYQRLEKRESPPEIGDHNAAWLPQSCNGRIYALVALAAP